MVYHNGGDAVTTFVDSGILRSTATNDNVPVTVEIALSSIDVKVYMAKGTNPMILVATLTADIPALSTPLFPFVQSQRSGGAGTKAIDIYKIFVGTV
jgi:hypothetical protein